MRRREGEKWIAKIKIAEPMKEYAQRSSPGISCRGVRGTYIEGRACFLDGSLRGTTLPIRRGWRGMNRRVGREFLMSLASSL